MIVWGTPRRVSWLAGFTPVGRAPKMKTFVNMLASSARSTVSTECHKRSRRAVRWRLDSLQKSLIFGRMPSTCHTARGSARLVSSLAVPAVPLLPLPVVPERPAKFGRPAGFHRGPLRGNRLARGHLSSNAQRDLCGDREGTMRTGPPTMHRRQWQSQPGDRGSDHLARAPV